MAIERHHRDRRRPAPRAALTAGLLVVLAGSAMAGGGAFRRGFPEDTAYTASSAAAPSLPGYLATFVDPVTLTGITRITRYNADWDWYPHHAYAKTQPWNIDQTLYKLYTVAVYDARTHRLVRELPGDLYPSYWSNWDPDILYSFREDGEIKTYRISTGQTEVLHHLTGYDTVKLGPGEGNLDIYDHMVALVGKQGQDLTVIVFDLRTASVVTTRTFPGAWGTGGPGQPEHIDWVSVSQSGQHVVISWDTGPPWDPQPFDGHFGVEVYDTLTMDFERRLARYGDHGDLCFTPARDEVYVQFWGDAGTINAYHLDDGQVDVIQTNSDFGYGDAHLSCRNILRPGWAYVSTDPARGGMVVGVKLDGSGTVELFGHHFSSAANYAKSPMPVPSPDGRKVMFKSDFGNAANPDEVYDFEAVVSDAQFVYRNGRDLDVQAGGDPPTFTVTRSDGTVLREPFAGERFFVDHSGGALQISYTIAERPGGVDIGYTITNPTGSEQPWPDFLVEGLGYAARTENDSLYILNTSTHQYLHQRFLSEDTFLDGSGSFKGWGYFDINGVEDLPYPRTYAPVIVAHDGGFAAGSALSYSYPATGLAVLERVRLSPEGRWSHAFEAAAGSAPVAPGRTEHLVLSVRFAAPRYWLPTLYPYKDRFDELFLGQSRIVRRDTRPISSVSLSYATVAWEQYQACLADGTCQAGQTPPENVVLDWNLRGYNWILRTDLYGLDGPNPNHGNRGFVSTYVQRLLEGGYRRAMLWTFSGQFWDCPPDKVIHGAHSYCGTNFPHQFMSDLLPAMEQSLGALNQFAANGIDLGFWWGRAGQVPQPLAWNPDDVVPLDPTNPNHTAFAENELALAVQRGATALGLDAFGNMARENQLGWLAHLKQLTPGVELWTEGSIPDYLHTQAALFLQPQNQWTAGALATTQIAEPSQLTAYINPDAEVIAFISAGAPTTTPEYLQHLVSWGYTPLIVPNPNIFDVPLMDVSDLDTTQTACCDGVDNDHDGPADFPWDPDCSSPTDDTEGSTTPPPPPPHHPSHIQRPRGPSAR